MKVYKSTSYWYSYKGIIYWFIFFVRNVNTENEDEILGQYSLVDKYRMFGKKELIAIWKVKLKSI